jgi:hypothetical protein
MNGGEFEFVIVHLGHRIETEFFTGEKGCCTG